MKRERREGRTEEKEIRRIRDKGEREEGRKRGREREMERERASKR